MQVNCDNIKSPFAGLRINFILALIFWFLLFALYDKLATYLYVSSLERCFQARIGPVVSHACPAPAAKKSCNYIYVSNAWNRSDVDSLLKSSMFVKRVAILPRKATCTYCCRLRLLY
jgi:hypothetical protein